LVSDRLQVIEDALVLDCHGQSLLGVLSRPASATPATVGVLVVVGGPQYRAGSHRQFVLLARALAAGGVPVLRFDHRGMGDSEGLLRDFEGVEDDIAAGIGALLQQQPQLQQVVLWGLCDGASAALLYLHATRDPRVAGLCLLNPWVRSAASLAKAQVKHYYRDRLLQRDFWAKFLRGGVAGKALRDLLANLRAAAVGSGHTAQAGEAAAQQRVPFQLRMAQAWAAYPGAVLLLLSERDATAQEFGEFSRGDTTWRKAMQARPPQRVSLPGADHTCSQPAARRAVEAATLQWLRQKFTVDTARAMPDTADTA
jgi:exosortase A-associated hydrolase 1